MATQQISRSYDPSLWVYFLMTFVVGALGAATVVQGDNAFFIVVSTIGLIGIATLILSPNMGLYIVLIVVYTNLSSVIVNVHGGPSILKVFLPFLLGVIWCRTIIFRNRFGQSLPIFVLLILYGALIASSLFHARVSLLVAEGLEDFIKNAIMVMIIIHLLRQVAQLKLAFWSLIGSAMFLSGISVFQQLTGTFENNYWGFALSEVEHIVGNVNNYRIAGPLATNFYAMIILAIVPLALDRLWSERIFWLRVVAAFAVLLCVLTVLFTFSRGGLIGLSVAVGYWIIQRRIQVRAILIVGALFIIAQPFIPGNYVARISAMVEALPLIGEGPLLEEMSLRGRLSEQIAAWEMFVDNPIVGVGYDNYPAHYLDYSEEIGLDGRREERQAHNLYLEVAAETGILGVMLFFSVLLLVFRGLRGAKEIFSQLNQRENAGMVVAIQASLIGYLTSSIFLHAAHPRYFWLFIGVAIAVHNVANNELIEGFSKRRFQRVYSLVNHESNVE